MENIVKTTIGVVHLGGMIGLSIYGFFFFFFSYKPHPLIDVLYLFSYGGIVVSWFVFRGECLISYFYKRSIDPTYQLGDDPENIEDIEALFPSKTAYRRFSRMNHIVRIISVIIVVWRLFYFLLHQ